MLRRSILVPIVCVAVLAMAMALVVQVVHEPGKLGWHSIGEIVAGGLILFVVTLPVPLVVYALSRRLTSVWMLCFGAWAIACLALGIWAAVSPI